MGAEESEFPFGFLVRVVFGFVINFFYPGTGITTSSSVVPHVGDRVVLVDRVNMELQETVFTHDVRISVNVNIIDLSVQPFSEIEWIEESKSTDFHSFLGGE
jgi:hypothetical protein